MAEHSVINDRFISQYSNLYNKVYGINGGSINRTQDVRAPDNEILISITSIVEEPQGEAYIEGQPIQFTAREIHFASDGGGVSGVRIFDEDTADREDSDIGFNVLHNVYGMGLEFDFENPLDSEDEFVGEVFTCRPRAVANADDLTLDYDVQWVIVPKSMPAGNGRHFVIITSAADAATYTGNVITSPFDDTPIKEGVDIYIPYAVGTPIEVGTKSWADFSAADDAYYLDKILAR